MRAMPPDNDNGATAPTPLTIIFANSPAFVTIYKHDVPRLLISDPDRYAAEAPPESERCARACACLSATPTMPSAPPRVGFILPRRSVDAPVRAPIASYGAQDAAQI